MIRPEERSYVGLFVATHLECWVGRRYRYLRHNLPHHRTHDVFVV